MESFIERLSARPDLYEKFSRILDLSAPENGEHGLDVDQLESLLKPEIREIRRVAVSEFATHTEALCAKTAKRENMIQREKER